MKTFHNGFVCYQCFCNTLWILITSYRGELTMYSLGAHANTPPKRFSTGHTRPVFSITFMKKTLSFVTTSMDRQVSLFRKQARIANMHKHTYTHTGHNRQLAVLCPLLQPLWTVRCDSIYSPHVSRIHSHRSHATGFFYPVYESDVSCYRYYSRT